MKKIIKERSNIIFKKIASLTVCVIVILSTFALVYADDKAVGEINGIVGKIVNIIAWFGYAIAFGMFVFVGIKYMMASANERADVKRGLINYLIGAFLIATASTVANVAVSIAVDDGDASSPSGLASSIVSVATDNL